MDVNDDTKLEDDLDWKGDHGLEPNWNMYYKYPSEEFVQSYRRDLELVEDTQDAVNESPRRHGLRKKAAENMANKGTSVKNKILEKSPELVINVGDVVLVPLVDEDRTKVDGGNLIGVVISTDKNKTTCRVAVKHGVLHKAYVYHALKLLPGTSNDIDLNDLREAFEDHGSLPKITERHAARLVSSVGGQGIVSCNCRSECNTNQCSCRKAGRLCSSRCHRNNHKCKNKQHAEDHGKKSNVS
jgi:ribosomal protein S17